LNKTETTLIKKELFLKDCLFLKSIYQKCGMTTKVLEVKPEIGKGRLTIYNFNGLTFTKWDVIFFESIILKSNKNYPTFLFSALITGDKKIKNVTQEIHQESLDAFICYLDKIEATISYAKNTRIKEVSFEMSDLFIKKHHLDSLLPLHKKFALDNIQNNITCLVNGKVQTIINDLVNDKKTGILKRLFLESKILELLSFQIDEKKQQKKHKQNNTIIKKIYDIEKLITENLHIQYTIQELAKKNYLNEFTLKKEFKRIFNKSIFQYSLNARINEAKNLLNNTTKPIYEIAELVGYKNATHFTAAFKRIEQKTPKQFRK